MIQLFGNIEHKRQKGWESEGEEERERKLERRQYRHKKANYIRGVTHDARKSIPMLPATVFCRM